LALAAIVVVFLVWFWVAKDTEPSEPQVGMTKEEVELIAARVGVRSLYSAAGDRIIYNTKPDWLGDTWQINAHFDEHGQVDEVVRSEKFRNGSSWLDRALKRAGW
jgi:hypothetical protein